MSHACRARVSLRALALVACARSRRRRTPALFDDDEARKAILDLRQQLDAEQRAARRARARPSRTRRWHEQIAQLKRSLLDLNNQIEQLRADNAKLRGQDEQLARDVAELQRKQKDIAAGRRRPHAQARAAEGVGRRQASSSPTPKRSASTTRRWPCFARATSTRRRARFVGLPASAIRPAAIAESALFWLGNAQYGKRDYKEAIALVPRASSARRPTARARPRRCCRSPTARLELKDAKGARKTLDELVKAYPKSEAAQAGKERLAVAEVAGAARPAQALPESRHAGRRPAGPGRTGAVGRLRAGRGVRRDRAAHALLHHGRGGRHRQHRRLDAHAHVGAGHRRGDDRLQRDGRRWAGSMPARASTPGRASSGCRPWSAALMFGFGMVLASGCGSKTLVRIGGGNLKSLVVFVVLGVAAFATLQGHHRRGARGHASTPSFIAAAGGPGPAVAAGRRPPAWRKPTLAAVLGRRPRRRAGRCGRWRAPKARSADDLLAGLGIGAVVVGAVVGVGAPRPRGRRPEHAAGGLRRHQLAAHGVAHLRRADRLHARLADALQRQEQGAHARHRHARWAWWSARRWWRWPRAASAGKAFADARTPPTTWSARC